MTDNSRTKNPEDPSSENLAHHDNVEVVAENVPLQGDALDRFVTVFAAAARRWELVVYPALLAFVILAAYGFFLIYTLSKDMHLLASGMDPQHYGVVLKTVLEASQKQAPVGPETRQALADSRAHSRPCAA